MSGFGTAISFVFVFVITSAMIGTSFLFLIEDTANKLEVLDENRQAVELSQTSFELNTPIYNSGRLSLQINNTGIQDLRFRTQSGNLCFSLFVNDIFISEDNLIINSQGAANVNYEIIEPNELGTISANLNLNESKENILKVVSCEGEEYYFTLESNSTDWFDEDWNYRKTLNITNTANTSLSEYQIVVDLDSSNYDFNLGQQNDFRIVLPIYQSFKLDLTFDNPSQRLTDHSNYKNNATLGLTPSSEGSDPLQANGVISNSLEFDGIDDTVRILQNDSLVIDNSLTYAAWVKWNGTGDSFQHIISNGVNGTLGIVRDGGPNDNSSYFNLSIEGVARQIFANITLDNEWNFLAGTYDGASMYLYQNGVIVGYLNTNGSIDSALDDNYIGSNGSTFYYNGSIDEVKIINYALTPSEVTNLYYNDLRFKELDYHIASWDGTTQSAKIYAKIPSIGINESLELQIYYNNLNNVNSTSDIESTFSYVYPRLIGYINNNRISDTIGLSIISLYDDNHIIIGDDVYFLDEQGTVGNLDETNLGRTDPIYAKKLVNIEGNGGGVNIINPISWSGTEFAIGRMPNNPDFLCINSPFGIADYTIYQVGALNVVGQVGLNGTCLGYLNYGGSDNTYINSSIPIQVYFYGTAANDAHPKHPMDVGNYYFVPSNRMDISAGPLGATALWYDSDGNSGAFNLGAYVDGARTALGNDGVTAGMKLIAQDPVGILKETDHDGNDMTEFLPEHQMGIRFGSNEAIDYVVGASPHSDANCTMYDNTGTQIQNIPTSSGTNGVYNYSFGNIGTDTQFTVAGWMNNM